MVKAVVDRWLSIAEERFNTGQINQSAFKSKKSVLLGPCSTTRDTKSSARSLSSCLKPSSTPAVGVIKMAKRSLNPEVTQGGNLRVQWLSLICVKLRTLNYVEIITDVLAQSHPIELCPTTLSKVTHAGS